MSERQTSTSMPKKNSPIDWEYDCKNCGRAFDSKMAPIIVVDDDYADVQCPWCNSTCEYEAPKEVERPPACVDTSVTVDENGCTIARMFFQGGSWVQYRETIEGRVREEMFNSDGEKIESFPCEIEHEEFAGINDLYDPPEAYLKSAVELYDKYTVRGIRIQKPHIYAVLVNGH